MLDYRNTTLEIEQGKPELAIFSIGAIEQHTAVLPIGTDTMIISEIARRVGRRLGAYVIPTVPFGTSYEHRGFAGTISIRPDTLYHFVKEMILSCYEQGIMKAAVLLGHGGLWTVKPAVRDLNYEHPEGQAIWLCPFDMGVRGLMSQVLETSDQEVHAGEFEVSCIMAIDEAAVKMEHAHDYVPKCGRETLDYLPMKAVSPTGVWGIPSKASKDKGERCLEILAQATADYITESFRSISILKSKTPGGIS
ncbi:MAG: Creatinine amidohydrolase [Firmicutes bacterium ADurb.Bin506]|jgi:creatinine amidohydrolase|nr:MAG: Creatinine amidohydrolase [Firmicutes bacterium ADurb.Bin506]